MKLLLENWRKFLNEEEDAISFLSGEEFDALNKEEQLKYAEQLYFAGVFSAGSKYEKPLGFLIRAKVFRHGFGEEKIIPKWSTEEFRAMQQAHRAKQSRGIEYIAPEWAKEIENKWNSGFYGEKSPQTFKKYARDIKIEWNKRADRSFFNKFIYVHWFLRPEWMSSFLAGGVDSTSELSSIGYPKKTGIVGRVWGPAGVGVVLDGYITLAGNVDLQTDLSGRKKAKGEQKYSGRIENLFIDESGWKNASIDEALIDNWTPVAIVLLKDKIPKEFEEVIKKSNLPILNSKFEEIQ
jgi:hypothetical protein